MVVERLTMLSNGFIILDKFSFKRYPFIKEGIILESLLNEIDYNNLGYEVKVVLRDAWNSRFWTTSGYDSSTFVKDQYEPRLAPFLHDYLLREGYGGYKADFIFKEIMKLTGSSKYRYMRDYIGVRIGWFGFLKWNHKIKGNVKETNINIDALYYTFKIK